MEELFDSLKNRYQNNLESIKGRVFVFDYAQFLYYKWHKTNPNCSGKCVDFPDSIKKKINNKSCE